MKVAYKIVASVAILLSLVSCEEKLDSESIFKDTADDKTSYTYEFDQYLYNTYTLGYNISFQYKLNDASADMDYNLVPVSFEKRATVPAHLATMHVSSSLNATSPSAAGAGAGAGDGKAICSLATTRPAGAHGASFLVANAKSTKSSPPFAAAAAAARPTGTTVPRESGAIDGTSTRPAAISNPFSRSLHVPSYSDASVKELRFQSSNVPSSRRLTASVR